MIGTIDFAKIKESIDLRNVAKQYGIKLDRKDFTCCVFHKEKTPSLRIEKDFFYCFGCGVNGDVFDFIGRLNGLNLIDTVRKMNYDYNLGLQDDFSPELMEEIRTEARMRKAERELRTQRKIDERNLYNQCADEYREMSNLLYRGEYVDTNRLVFLTEVMDLISEGCYEVAKYKYESVQI